MTNEPKKKHPLIQMLEESAARQREALAESEHTSNNLADELRNLCNEFLAAGKGKFHHGQVIVALIDTLALTLAQSHPDNEGRMFDDLDRIKKVLRVKAVQYLIADHCRRHHPGEAS